jgi:hypothetical protein
MDGDADEMRAKFGYSLDQIIRRELL